ncbi:hypothetical protein C3405_24655, partial [Aeromonas hydrophila]
VVWVRRVVWQVREILSDVLMLDWMDSSQEDVWRRVLCRGWAGEAGTLLMVDHEAGLWGGVGVKREYWWGG